MTDYHPTRRSRVKRLAKRARYDRDTVHAIIDEALVCHVAFTVDGTPRVLPTAIVRIDEQVYIHGNRRSAMLQALATGAPACIGVTLLDGLVLARSGFHCSMNYRAVVIHGSGERVEGEEKTRALSALMDHLVPGHWEVMAPLRPHTRKELSATTVLRFTLDEVSAKVRSGPPVDDDADYGLPIWAGVLPLALRPGKPVADERLAPGVHVPRYVSRYRRRAPRKSA